MLEKVRTYLLLLIGMLSLSFVGPIPTKVGLVNNQLKYERFKVKKIKVQWVNNHINIALLSTDNRLIQLNNIKQDYMKDTVFNDPSVNLVFIDQNETYTSRAALLPQIEIRCANAKPNQPFYVFARGKVFTNNKWYWIEFKTTQYLPPPQHNG